MAVAQRPRKNAQLFRSSSTTNLMVAPVSQTSAPACACSTLGAIVRTAHSKNKRDMRRRDSLHRALQQSQFWRHLQRTFLTNPAESDLFENMTVQEYENYCRARMADVHSKPQIKPSTDRAPRRSDPHPRSIKETEPPAQRRRQRRSCPTLIAVV
ncbi:uncharacterized protein MONBRDRAFT_35417 [Monosiga brevicollis MX1]|uniref:Uncharacterized protein n=1 Tax=Monosiga brevicollis TaxID=81824 RepID=A9UNV7_MONBE|nr:uncharacterized protein MONBRDRAFT_35417 [Monosiga brevicollis MX1]EDQ92311.1 predicted protein [Monosiga brevicollis MX1]|eukprot:XP_001742073.1 hypothetical protein [Monosiga brevicollis MX1]